MLLRQIILIALGVISSVLIHFGVLRAVFASRWMRGAPHRWALLVFLFLLLFAHVLEIGVYAALFALGVEAWGIGGLSGTFTGSSSDYFYYSAVTYTTVGFGDITPTDRMRTLTAFEALNGVVLIGWSTSASFLAMRRAFAVDPKV